MPRSPVWKGTELWLKPRLEFLRSISLNYLKMFWKSFVPLKRRPLQQSVSRSIAAPNTGERPQAHGGGTVVIVGQHSGHRQTNEGGGRVVVVGQSAGTLKIVIAGIVLLVVVVLAIVRSRF